MKASGNGQIAETSDYAIDLHDVKKVYRGKIHALRGIDMQVHEGEVFGLLGPNGAGKSTLVKIMMTVVRPTKVRGTMLGRPIGHKPTLARVGYLPEHHQFPTYLTGLQVLHFYGSMTGVGRPTRRRRAEELLRLVGMSDWAKKKISTYSKGMLQRVGLAQAMINDPELIVLDEPTDGLDPVGRREVRDVLIQLRERGKTIFLNSHLLSELEMVCSRVAILAQGRVAMQGTLDDLTKDSRRIEFLIEGDPPTWINKQDNLTVGSPRNGHTHLWMRGDDVQAAQPIIDRLRKDGVTIHSIRPVRESLEDLFMRAVNGGETHQPQQVGARNEESAA